MRGVIRGIVLGLLVALVLPGIASAAFSDYVDTTGALNTIDYKSRGIFLRETATDVWTPIDFVTLTPTTGDVWVGVLSSITLRIDDATDPIWKAGPGDYLTGYEVKEVDTASATSITYKNPSKDPFGKLAPGEMLAIYEQTSDWIVNGSPTIPSLTTSVGSATLVTALATFGISDTTAVTGDFAETAGLISTTAATLQGLEALTSPGGVFVEDTYVAGRGDHDAGGTGVNQLNSAFGVTSPWMFKGNGEFSFRVVPEPGTLAIWGGLIMIGGVVGWRRRRK